MSMSAGELLKLLESRGASIKEIRGNCRYEALLSENIFNYCRQQGNRDYVFNLGSAGGPVIACTGAPPLVIGSHQEMREGGEVTVIDYAPNPPPCPYYIENGEVIGWRILLPKDRG